MHRRADSRTGKSVFKSGSAKLGRVCGKHRPALLVVLRQWRGGGVGGRRSGLESARAGKLLEPPSEGSKLVLENPGKPWKALYLQPKTPPSPRQHHRRFRSNSMVCLFVGEPVVP